jgi:hypothetical protein
MLVHPVRREIDQPISMMGLEQDDLIVLAAAGYLISALVPSLPLKVGQADLTFGVQMLALAVIFTAWMVFRRDKPRYFLRDTISYLAEPDAWIPTPDVWARPVVQPGTNVRSPGGAP